ncbi:MAG: thioredoxin domain-containing protein [Syntrophaceae bacterium]|nr:thioredoxin domain-containing protein [Syntrophaceae bacterium]
MLKPIKNSLPGQEEEKQQLRVMQFLSDHRRMINLLMSLLGMGVVFLYYYCGSSCLYLAGTVFGLDLKIWGILYFSLFAVLALLRQKTLICVFLAGGLGAEIYLVGYQVLYETFCPYCLILAAIIVLLFALNFDKRKCRIVILCLILGLVGMGAFFRSIPLKIEKTGEVFPSFGRGVVQVRFYTDYFCGPCRAVDQEAEAELYDLARKDRISLTFVDVPIHRQTPMYTAYYLALSQREKELDRVLRIRKALFRAAESRIEDRAALDAYLLKNGFRTQNIDIQVDSAAGIRYMKEDGVNGTPTLVVISGQTKTNYLGRIEVMKGLQTLK